MRSLIVFFCIPLAVVAFWACQNESQQEEGTFNVVSSGDELLSEAGEIGQKALYPDIAEVESTSFERSFENAPPLIPHTVKGMMVMTQKHNECMLCHMPNKAKEKGATALPKTHFTNFRPEIVQEGDLYLVKAEVNEVVQKSTGDHIASAMYNCNLCHVPQANITVNIDNLFEADFRSASGKSKSNLSKNMKEGVN